MTKAAKVAKSATRKISKTAAKEKPAAKKAAATTKAKAKSAVKKASTKTTGSKRKAKKSAGALLEKVEAGLQSGLEVVENLVKKVTKSKK
jgi:hypothetical protein